MDVAAAVGAVLLAVAAAGCAGSRLAAGSPGAAPAMPIAPVAVTPPVPTRPTDPLAEEAEQLGRLIYAFWKSHERFPASAAQLEAFAEARDRPLAFTRLRALALRTSVYGMVLDAEFEFTFASAPPGAASPVEPAAWTPARVVFDATAPQDPQLTVTTSSAEAAAYLDGLLAAWRRSRPEREAEDAR
ncbi:MAG TPA: hypothetical protein VGB20_05370 [bacterium]